MPDVAVPYAFVDWDATGATNGPYDDISADILSADIALGGSELGAPTTSGSCTLIVDNATGKYNEWNAASPLYGQIRRNRYARVVATYGGTTYGLFDGFIRNVIPIPDDSDPTAQIILADRFERWRRTPVDVAFGTGRRHMDLRAAVLDALAVPASHRSLSDDEVHGIAYSEVNRSDGVTALDEVNRATGSRHFIQPGTSDALRYTYAVRSRQYGLRSAVAATLVRGTDFDDLTEWSGFDGVVVNEQTVRPFAQSFGDISQVWSYAAAPHLLRSGSTRVIWADFGTRVRNPTLVWSGNGIASVSMVSLTSTAKITIVAQATPYPEITTLTISGEPLRADENMALGVATDTASQATYGVETGAEISSPLIGSEAIAAGLAGAIVWRFRDPRQRPALRFVNRFPGSLSRQLGDWVGITDPRLGLSGWRAEIVAIRHLLEVGARRWTTEMRVQEAPVQGTVTDRAQMGVSTLNGSHFFAR